MISKVRQLKKIAEYICSTKFRQKEFACLVLWQWIRLFLMNILSNFSKGSFELKHEMTKLHQMNVVEFKQVTVFSRISAHPRGHIRDL